MHVFKTYNQLFAWGPLSTSTTGHTSSGQVVRFSSALMKGLVKIPKRGGIFYGFYEQMKDQNLSHPVFRLFTFDITTLPFAHRK